MKKFITSFFVTVALFLAVGISSAQQSVTNGAIRVTFPTADWAETQPPSQLRDALDRTKSQLKLVVHAVSQSSQLRFYATRYDYPSNDLSIGLAGYLDGVRGRCARQARGEPAEKLINIGGFPVQTFEADLPRGMFIEIRTILCASCLYSLEIGGPAASRQEAKRCLDSLLLVGERPLPSSVVESILRVRTQTAGTKAAYERGRRFGYVAGYVIFASLVAVILVLAFRRKPAPHSPHPLPSRKAVPPPLPSPAVPPVVGVRSKSEDDK